MKTSFQSRRTDWNARFFVDRQLVNGCDGKIRA